ncbi:MAG TPA: phospholipase D-like domain-containing protein [Casimicrobiaceae bacterium]|jgi:cardiolipin synthase|nr:phospholipase D-like domain-containing protein [Casimicrobiaceae bacterium]
MKTSDRKSNLLIVGITAVVTLAIAGLGINLSGGEKMITRPLGHLYAIDDPQFQRTLGVLLGPEILTGNRYDVYVNGDEIFPPMLAAIHSARRTISFETYIYWSGSVGQDFADALSERARAGVKVHVLLDWVGSSKMDKRLLDAMERAGVEVRRFHQPSWHTLNRLNNRTHRKILVVDGTTGFTGGVGIADEWSGHAQDPQHWRDTHFRIVGPTVAQLQAVFADNWVKATGIVLHGNDYFPEIEPAGDGPAQVFASSPSGGSQSMELMYLLIINAAVRSVDLSAAYFVPDEIARDTIVAALKRGVRVRIITPGPHVDAETVRRASRALWGDLLAAGAEIYEYQPTMYHAKVLVVDDFLVSVGSTNFDDRSFHLNDEATLNIFDRTFARRQEEIFERDLEKSRRMTLAAWRSRPLLEKLWEHASALLGPQL